MGPEDVKAMIQESPVNGNPQEKNLMSFTYIKKDDPNFELITHPTTPVRIISFLNFINLIKTMHLHNSFEAQ